MLTRKRPRDPAGAAFASEAGACRSCAVVGLDGRLCRVNRHRGTVPDLPSRRSRAAAIFLALSIIIPLAALVLQIHRTYPFHDDVSLATAQGQDWLSYKTYALSIEHDGWDLPAMRGNYKRPGGIGYPYFVAAIFALLGDNSTWVYVIQGTLIALGAVVMVRAFKHRFSTTTLVVLLIAQAIYAYLDVSRWYSQKLLSEDLLIILLPWFYLAIMRAWETRSAWAAAVAGGFLGLAILVRPNVLPVAVGVIFFLVVYLRRSGRALALTLAFLAGVAIAHVPLVARNLVATGGTFSAGTISPAFASTRDWAPTEQSHAGGRVLRKRPLAWYAQRALYCMGVTEYGNVWRWIVLWLLTCVLLGYSLARKKLEFGDAILLATVGCYLFPLILFAGIKTYGVRMILPIIPSLLVLAMGGVIAIPSWFGERERAKIPVKATKRGQRRSRKRSR